MQQSNVIFAALFVAFVVYITSKGELPNYINILKGAKTAPDTSPLPSTMPSISTSSIEQQAAHLLAQSPGIQIPFPPPPIQ